MSAAIVIVCYVLASWLGYRLGYGNTPRDVLEPYRVTSFGERMERLPLEYPEPGDLISSGALDLRPGGITVYEP